MIHNEETIKDEVVDGVIELFDYLKANNKDDIKQLVKKKWNKLNNYL